MLHFSNKLVKSKVETPSLPESWSRIVCSLREGNPKLSRVGHARFLSCPRILVYAEEVGTGAGIMDLTWRLSSSIRARRRAWAFSREDIESSPLDMIVRKAENHGKSTNPGQQERHRQAGQCLDALIHVCHSNRWSTAHAGHSPLLGTLRAIYSCQGLHRKLRWYALEKVETRDCQCTYTWVADQYNLTQAQQCRRYDLDSLFEKQSYLKGCQSK